MGAIRLTSALWVGLVALPALAAERTASFSVTVEVVSPLSVRAPSRVALVSTVDAPVRSVAQLPAESWIRGGGSSALVGWRGEPARPCGGPGAPDQACRVSFATPSSPAARAPGAAAVGPSARPLVLTFLPDGAPSAILER